MQMQSNLDLYRYAPSYVGLCYQATMQTSVLIDGVCKNVEF